MIDDYEEMTPEAARELKILRKITNQTTGGYDSVERPYYYKAIQDILGVSMSNCEDGHFIEHAIYNLDRLIEVATKAKERLNRENDQPTLF